ncbi:hypothetical protein CARUB_v10028152mg [Capsella rubella]|uniref:Glycine-rich domain-containing protein-like n=1 Tax=Capsella rubella TaxID=81985 RepID=R0EV66_9BRAS|nr:glycine-rich domain-containing protein 2 [Capsella rubella]EOA12726.1 hypothetical protein CARUB_v10028152mg [Capsella rubella]
MEKEEEQKLEWLESQKIETSIDLFAAAKQQLQFLAVVEHKPWLYHGPILEKAIYRYNAYWLPLLAKYSESSDILEGPLVPPLDCEWVWHCHRLNPVRYIVDCHILYEKVLDNSGVTSSTSGSCKLQTENLWKELYPMEPYELDMVKANSERVDLSTLEKYTTYDLVSAVNTQSSFYYTFAKTHDVDSDIIIQEAVGRYKAFLHLLKRNKEKSIKLIIAPTYDIDLIWHTHLLHPSFYYKDTVKILGSILQHLYGKDSNKSKAETLESVFSEISAQWEDTYGQIYCKARAETSTEMEAVNSYSP